MDLLGWNSTHPIWFSLYQESASSTYSSLNHHLLQVFADVSKHWPLVRLLLPALQHQTIPGRKCRQAVTTQ